MAEFQANCKKLYSIYECCNKTYLNLFNSVITQLLFKCEVSSSPSSTDNIMYMTVPAKANGVSLSFLQPIDVGA